MNTVLQNSSNYSETRWIWIFSFAAAIIMTLFYGKFLWLARIGWVLLGILFTVHWRYGIYALFFFSAFFHSAGFLPNLPWTIKHFHIAFLIVVTVFIMQNRTLKNWKKFLKESKPLMPLAVILGISLANILIFYPSFYNFRTSANLFSIFAIILSLKIFLSNFLYEDVALIIKKSLLVFSSAIALQVLIAVINHVFKFNFLNINLFHNNHLGNLCSAGFFCVIPMFIAEKKNSVRIYALFLSGVIFSGIVLSCSRTAWLSFAICLFLFLFFTYTYASKTPNFKSGEFYNRVLYLIIGITFATFLICLLNENVFSRMSNIKQLIDKDYWIYTINDVQNFGFLGRLRREQFLEMFMILKEHLLFGIGFIHRVVDFHGFFMVILGGTGILGFFVFCCFVINYIRNFFISLSIEKDDSIAFLKIGVFSSFCAWLLSSITETFIVHFFVWIIILSGIILFSKTREVQ